MSNWGVRREPTVEDWIKAHDRIDAALRELETALGEDLDCVQAGYQHGPCGHCLGCMVRAALTPNQREYVPALPDEASVGAVRAHLIQEFEAVYRQWMERVGDAHDAWNVEELADAALRAIGQGGG